jgi:hypothetical protein
MASVQAFNELMDQFIQELRATFPEESSIKKCANAFDLMAGANSKGVMELFMGNITPYSQQLMAKDDAFFVGENSDIKFVNDLNLKNLWTADLSQNTKNAIWQYLQTLFMMGTTIQAVPPDMMKSIETMAEQCASQLEGQDPTQLGSSLMGMLGSMFSGGGIGESPSKNISK